MRQWLDSIHTQLDFIRWPIPASEENYITIQFCDGHMVHVGTVAELREAVNALSQKLADADRDSENGSMAAVKQEIITLFGIVTNVWRLA